MQATKEQKQLIHINSPTRDMKEEYVQWATGDNSKISADDLTFDQANAIMVQILGLKPHKPKFLAVFDHKNPRHKKILSILLEMGWKTWNYENRRFFANMDKLNEWMLSDKCPVKGKRLLDMDDEDLNKFIAALQSMHKKKFK